MFGSIDKSKGLLFVTNDLMRTLPATIHDLQKEVESLNENRLLNTAPDDLKQYLIERYSVEPIVLLRDKWYLDHQDVQVDVRHDSMRWIEDRSRPVLVAGQRFEVRIPFTGESELFYCRSNMVSMDPPRAVVDKGELVLRIEMPADSPQDVRPMVDRVLLNVEQHLGWQRDLIEGHNSSLPAIAEQAIQQRRERLLAQAQRAAATGIPVRRRQDAPVTYALPVARKTATPSLPAASASPYSPEPAWATEQYEHALKVMQDMALVMERSPDAFKTMDEEALRQHFLVQLNGQFEGKATAETFNMSGKTDILLREGDRNVFIAECKFWRGPKAYAEAIDQLLSYSTWRDSKTAILLFNRGTQTSTVLSGVDETTQAHKNFKRVVAWPHEAGFRYVLHANGDSNRELTLTILIFHVPR